MKRRLPSWRRKFGESGLELLLQCGLLSAMVAYLIQRRVDLHRRTPESEESLIARFETAEGTVANFDPAAWISEFNEFDELDDAGIASRERGAAAEGRNLQGMWQLYRRAGLVMRLADKADPAYATGAAAVDPSLLMSLRRHAMQARIAALTGMARWALQG